jgi:putative flippase GtrA
VLAPRLQKLSSLFARFGAVGALGVLVNNAVLVAAHGLAGLPLLIASVLAVEIAILHNFFWHERWTFGGSRFSLLRLGKFNLTSLGGLIIATAVLYVLVTYFDIHYLLANIAGIGAATAWNFATSLIWTWSASE